MDGLKPYPAMKDSGVPWLGDVPEHWEVSALGRLGRIAGGMTPSMEQRRFWDGEIPWVTPKDMKQALIRDSVIRVSEAAVRETGLGLIEPQAVLTLIRQNS